MKRPHLNFLIDAAAFAAFLFLLSTGLLLRYQLPPGSGSLQGRGTGHGAGGQMVTSLWGWTRHEWGEIHFWVAVVLIAVLALHLFLHWKWIVCIVRGQRGDASGGRFALGLAALATLVILAGMPLFSPTESATREQLRNADSVGHVDASDWDRLRGSMTLEEAAVESGVSVEYLREHLGLPEDASPRARLGPLLRGAGKRMSDLHELIEERPDADYPQEEMKAAP